MDYTITLNQYQLVNLRSALEAIGYPYAQDRSPLDVLNTGDWIGELHQKLVQAELKPNAAPADLRKRARIWKEP